MTKKEFLTAIAKNDSMSAEMVEFAKNELQKMESAAEKRKAKPSKAAMENEVLAARVAEFLQENGENPLSNVAEAFSVSSAKITAAVRPLVESGVIVKGKIKDGNKSHVTLRHS